MKAIFSRQFRDDLAREERKYGEISEGLAGAFRERVAGQAREITLDASLHALYRQRLESWLDEVRDTCVRRQMAYLLVSTETPIDKVIFSDLRRLQLVK